MKEWSIKIESFNYLRSWKGIDFLDKGYEVGHLFSIEDAVDDLTAYCKRQGGELS